MVMINVDSGKVQCKIKGDPTNIMVEVARAISAIHQQFAVQDEVVAAAFRTGLYIATQPGSPIWELSESAVVIDKSEKNERYPQADQS